MGEDFMGAEINLWLNSASIDTGNAQRDAHLKSADFFDVENFKEINFTSHNNIYEKANQDGLYEMDGGLTIEGIKKQIKLDLKFGGIIKDPWGNHKAIFNINGKLSRKDWSLNWNAAQETGGVLVSDDVWINCEIQLTRQS